MSKVFQGDVAYLNGTDLGTLLIEIGKVRLPKEPSDPQLAFIARIERYTQQLEADFRQMDMDEREQNPTLLRVSGWLQSMLRMKHVSWHQWLPRFLRGMIRFEADQKQQEGESPDDESFRAAA